MYDIVYASFPFLADGVGNLFLGGLEALIGVTLIGNFFFQTTHAAFLLHLAGTFAVFITAPELMFRPYFPILTLAGGFVVKNLSLAMGGIAVILCHMCHPRFSKGWL